MTREEKLKEVVEISLRIKKAMEQLKSIPMADARRYNHLVTGVYAGDEPEEEKSDG